ncbi:MAG: glycine cleavage system protein GcvH [Clostridiales Family XIII bacterium]|jgi:glycine cleavage system H protein|nr:glycine cleavage system protein GcvH [Clostridiales Family XIII bacterium]
MNNPHHLKYAKTHEWVEFLPDSTLKIGLTDYAQNEMGALVFVNLPEAGDAFSSGDIIGDVESVKTVSDIYAPVSGTVTAINEELLDTPEMINADPYGAWLVQVGDAEIDEPLLSAEEYEAFVAEGE